MDLLHHLHVQGLQSVAGGRDEVETGVDPLVSDIKPGEESLSENIVNIIVLSPLHPGLGLQVAVELVLHIVHYGGPALGVVHGLTEAGSVDNSQREFYSVLN